MDNENVLIRKGTEADLPAFFELYWISSVEHAHFTGILDIPKPKAKCKEYIINRQQELLKDENQFLLVAEKNTKIIGMITGHVGDRDEFHVYSIERIGYIDELCVHPNDRNKDIGKQLVDGMLALLYAKAVTYVGVGVAFKNPAFHFYKTKGFNPEGMWLIQQKKEYKKRIKKEK
jgi:ribosomal protein S18 acetylase RimI-like enzyme